MYNIFKNDPLYFNADISSISASDSYSLPIYTDPISVNTNILATPSETEAAAVITVTSREAKEFVYNTLVDEISGSGSLCGHKECLCKHNALPDVLEFALTDNEMVEVQHLPGVINASKSIGEPELLYDKIGQSGKIKLASFNNDPGNISHSILYSQDYDLKYTSDSAVNGSTVSTLSSIDCSNVDIIVVDSGVDPDHSDFLDSNGVSRVVQFDWSVLEKSLIDPQATTGTIIDSLPLNYYRDLNGHGTSCASLVAGNKSGMAKNAKIYAINIVEANPPIATGSNAMPTALELILAFQKAKKQNLHGLDSTRPTVCTNSWGYNQYAVHIGAPGVSRYTDFNRDTWDTNLNDIGFNDTYTRAVANAHAVAGGTDNQFNSYAKGRNDVTDGYFRQILNEGVHCLTSAGNSNIFQKNDPAISTNVIYYDQGPYFSAIGKVWGLFALTYIPATPALSGIRNWERISSKGGQCGNNSVKTLSTLTLIDDGPWSDISCSSYTTFGIKAGKLYSWGGNHYGLLGRSSASLGDVYTNGASSDGTEKANELADNPAINCGSFAPRLIVNPSDSKIPTAVNNWNDWTQIAAGPYHAIGIRGGKLYGWGLGYYGATGVATTAGELNSTERVERCINIPTQIGTDSDWAYVSCGTTHTLGLKTNGELYAWGSGPAIGYDPATDTNLSINDWGVNTPVRVRSSTNNLDFNSYDSDWTYILAGNGASYGIRNNGELYAWGNSQTGKLGTTGSFQSTDGGRVGTNDNLLFSSVATSYSYVLSITTDGKLYQWGNVGIGNREPDEDGTVGRVVTLPEQVGTDTDWVDINISCRVSGFGISQRTYEISSLAKKQNGNVIGWGYNNCYQVAEVPRDDDNYLKFDRQQIINIPGNCEKFAKGYAHSIFINSTGKLYAIGSNAGGGPIYSCWGNSADGYNNRITSLYSYGSPGIGLNTKNVLTYTKDAYPMVHVGDVTPIGSDEPDDNDVYFTGGVSKAVYSALSGIDSVNNPITLTNETRYSALDGPFFVKTPYSDFGPNVDIYAPGNGAWAAVSTTITTDLADIPTINTGSSKFRFFNGTSASCPIVAGCLATYLSEFPTKTPAEAREWLLNNAVKGSIAVPESSSVDVNTYNVTISAFSVTNIPIGPTNISTVVTWSNYCFQKGSGVSSLLWKRSEGALEALRYACRFQQSHNRIVQAFPLRQAILATNGENTVNINNVTLTLSGQVTGEKKTHLTE